jgi:hypothetical protein
LEPGLFTIEKKELNKNKNLILFSQSHRWSRACSPSDHCAEEKNKEHIERVAVSEKSSSE